MIQKKWGNASKPWIYMQESILLCFQALVSSGTMNLLMDMWDGGRAVSCATLHIPACREICPAGVESLLLPHLYSNVLLDLLRVCVWYALARGLEKPVTTLYLVEKIVLLWPVFWNGSLWHSLYFFCKPADWYVQNDLNEHLGSNVNQLMCRLSCYRSFITNVRCLFCFHVTFFKWDGYHVKRHLEIYYLLNY